MIINWERHTRGIGNLVFYEKTFGNNEVSIIIHPLYTLKADRSGEEYISAYEASIGSRPTEWLANIKGNRIRGQSESQAINKVIKIVEFYWKAYNKKW